MHKVHPWNKAFGVMILCLAFASLAHATSARTWVSNSAGAADAGACTRGAPCKTFAFAIGQTTAGGEIDALDPGDYGQVTIDRSVTIDGTQGNGFASIMVDATGNSAGFTINAGATDVVTIRNVTINGQNGTGGNGIVVNTAGTVHIENCVVTGTSGSAIADIRTGNVNDVFYLYIKDTIAKNAGTRGVRITSVSSGVFLIAALTNVRAQDNATEGVEISGGTYASLDDCNITGNRSDGLLASGNAGGAEGTANAASASVKNSVFSNNGNGITATAGGFVRISGVQVFDNTKGLNQSGGGTIISYGNNEIDGNTTDGAPSSTIPRK
jgi:hypothetical protein